MDTKAKAFIFDLNGTMIDDMQFHIRAWHRIVNELGAGLSIEEVKKECYGKNDDLLERIFPGRFSKEEMDVMSMKKERQYQQEFRPHLKLINGLDSFLKKAQDQNIGMAVGSAAIMFNINFVLDGLDIRQYIDAIVSADDVEKSKPDPETFIKCADLLGVDYEDCIVFEDAPKGVEAAENAGMQTIVLTTMDIEEDFVLYNNIIGFCKDFNDEIVLDLLRK